MEEVNIAKQFLRGYKTAKINLELALNQIEELRGLIDIKGVGYDGVKVVTSKEKGSGLEAKIAKIADLDQRVDDMIVVASDMLQTVQDVIETIEDNDYRILLSKRYVKCQGWKTIASDMNISVRQVHRIHGEALTEVENLLKNRKVGTQCH